MRQLEAISYGSPQKSVARSPVMKLGRTMTIKSGNDEGSDWASALFQKEALKNPSS